MEAFRNMSRRKFRTFLTIFGIVIGIFAFTVMGSMALKLNKMIEGGKKYITGQITIVPKGTDFSTGAMSGMLPVDTLQKISQVEGVEAVAAMIEMSLDEPDPDNPINMSFGVPATIEGTDLDSEFKNLNWQTLEMKDGRMIEKGDPENYITIGTTISLDKGWEKGETVKIRGRDFYIVGVIDKTMTAPDSYVFMDIKIARELYIEANPFLKSLKEKSDDAAKISERELANMPVQTRKQILEAKSFKGEDITTMAAVSWKEGEDSDIVSDRIKNQFKNDVIVLSPNTMGEQIDKASATINAVVLGSALLALIVGLFSIVNTMVMSISERTKEIGIKKAIGASPKSIALEYTLEAGIIGFIGGAIGLGFGTLTIYLINQRMAEKGAEIFLLSGGFALGVLIFSFVIGIIAGLLPAVRASKLKVVEAIREL